MRDKFRRNGKAREILVNTGHVKLIYTNRHDDRIWGVCGGRNRMATRFCASCIGGVFPAGVRGGVRAHAAAARAPTRMFSRALSYPLGKGDNKLGKLLERVRADMLAGKDIEAWCATRFLLVPKLDVAVGFAVVKGGKVVAEPAFEGQPVIRMGRSVGGKAMGDNPR